METEEREGGLVKMSSTFAIDINVRFYDFLQKKAFLLSKLTSSCASMSLWLALKANY